MKKIKCAVIGCGAIARSQHIPAYAKNPSVELAYLVDSAISRAEELSKSYENPKAVSDYKMILEDRKLDAVSICLPNFLHAQVAIDCLNAGKHVLCEKPIALNFEEALKMKEAADKNGKILAIGMVNRFNTAVNIIKDMISSGELGELYHIYCSFKNYRSIPGLGSAFTAKKLSGGGVLIDWGVHFIDLVLYCIGEIMPTSTSAEAYSALGRDMRDYAYINMWAGPPDYSGTYDVEDYITGLIRTDGPSIGFSGAWAQNINESAMYVEFHGSKAGIKLNYGEGFTIYSHKEGLLYETKPMFRQVNMFEEEVNSFVGSVIGNKKTKANIDNVIIVQKVLDSIYKSAEERREITL